MCGIFGYVGPQASARVLIESLKRLEYRGYDSWGVALGRGEELCFAHTVGRIGEAKVPSFAEGPSDARFWGGVAHTRWATHGAPTELNAHPHRDCKGDLAVVHNGIIENHTALRAELEQAGHTFRSGTDTEVVPHLVEEFMKKGLDFPAAFLDAVKLLEGAFGLAAICAAEPGMILAARRGSPLVIGVGQDEMLLASDPAALVMHTRQAVYLEDGEAAILRVDGYETHDFEAAPVSREVQQIAFDLPAIERNGYPCFMLKEIFEQPESIHNAFRGRILHEEGTARLGGIDETVLRMVSRCHIVACGTAWHAGLVGKYLLENLARVPTQVSYGAEFRYANPVIEPGTLVIAVSQSGETLDTLEAVREAKLRGATAIGIVNVVGSTIARECGQGVYIHAGPEIGVASTKAFTGQVVALLLLAISLGRMRDMPLRDAVQYLEALEELPRKVESALQCDERIREIADEYADSPNFLYVGRLYEYPLALEGALKLKEISYIHAEGIPAAELKHGPIALVDPRMPTVVLAAQSAILDKMLGNVQEIRARGGTILAIGREGEGKLSQLAAHTISIPATLDLFVPVVEAIPLQLLAYHIAVRRGCDVDRPRNLAKSVTVE
ncbi:MAG: glutamine--fructose-6-phosphate transaminase (isomerizing) [Planctomycetota bacterium]|jgi:glucosamine--fructose-6-phosphate aminotransferase (isomerizing)